MTTFSSVLMGFRYPKKRFSMAKIETLSEQVIKLSHENVKLREIKVFADRKIKVLTIFEVYQDDVISVLCTKFRAFKRSDDSGQETLKQEVNDVLEQSDGAVAVGALIKDFPDMEHLVSLHESPEILSISSVLGEWIDQADHIGASHA